MVIVFVKSVCNYRRQKKNHFWPMHVVFVCYLKVCCDLCNLGFITLLKYIVHNRVIRGFSLSLSLPLFDRWKRPWRE